MMTVGGGGDCRPRAAGGGWGIAVGDGLTAGPGAAAVKHLAHVI